MTTPVQKTPKRKTTKKRQLSKLPASLPNYNYEAFSYKDIQRAATYYQAELTKIEKLIGKVTQISKAEQSVGGTTFRQPTYQDIAVHPNNFIGDLPPQPPRIMPATGINPFQPNVAGDWIDIPMVCGGISPKPEVYEIIQQPAIVDNSADLESELKGMLNQNAV
jgi:hypothetical protein